MYPALGCYGPSLQDQGIGPDDEPDPGVPLGARVDLKLFADFFYEDPIYRDHDFGPWCGMGKRLTMEEFKEFESDLDKLLNKWGDDNFRCLWVIRYLEGLYANSVSGS